MNYYKKLLHYLFPIWILVSINYSQDLNIDFTLLNTGQFTLNSWNNVPELWKLEIENTGAVKIDYYLKFILKNNNEDIVEGHTAPLSINSGENSNYHNLDPVFDQSNLSYYNEANPEFISNIKNITGYLPAGQYKLELIAVDLDGGATLSSDEEEIVYTLGDQFSIEYPNDGQVFPGGGQFYFQWDTPGFRQGVNIEFRIIISAIISEEVDSPEDAIELGSNAVFYFDSNWGNLPISGGWPYVELGYSRTLNFWYFTLISETGMEQLECGFDYAWRMDAREVINGFGTVSGDQGLWGWPEPVQSVVRKFTWGDNACLSMGKLIIPEDFNIHSIYPNPFNPITNITYGLPEHVNVQILVYDLSGKQVETLINEFQTPGYHSINWDADNLPSGVYLIRMDSGEFTQTQKVVLIK